MQIFYIINTSKESGISLENSLGCDRVYTLVSLKKGDVKESRYEEMLEGFENYDRTDAVAKLVRKNNDWENSMFLLTSCQGW